MTFNAMFCASEYTIFKSKFEEDFSMEIFLSQLQIKLIICTDKMGLGKMYINLNFQMTFSRQCNGSIFHLLHISTTSAFIPLFYKF